MSTDPIQALIDAGAIPSDPFGPDSRYAGAQLGLLRRGDADPGTPYVRRRFIPQQREVSVALEYIVHGGDRPDSLAAKAFGNPELYWRIADANAVTDPFELTEETGGRIFIPAPPGA